MALFKKKTTEKKEVKKVADSTKGSAVASSVIAARVTEKSGIASETLNMYTFEVSKDSTKKKIAHAITAKYKVVPTKINIVKLPAKKVFVRGKFGNKAAVKKAYIFLKKGDKIEFA